VAWALVLGVIAYASVDRDAPTVRDQRSIGEARPIVDRAVGEVAKAAGSDVVLHISGYEVRDDCRITPVRPGRTLERDVTIYTREADGPALLDRIAERLPEGYAARARHAKGRDTLRADAGEFVAVSGGVTAPGVVILTVDTGCRPPADLPAAPQPTAEDRETAGQVLAALGGTVSEVSVASAPCPGGGTVRTVEIRGEPGDPPRPMRDVLIPLFGTDAPGPPLLDMPERFAYRAEEAAVSASVTEADGGEVEVAVTTGC
jgi:hypothetical protein